MIDHATQVGAGFGVIAVPFLHDDLRLRHELVLDIFGAQNVIRRDARLSGVDELSPHDATRGTPDVDRVVDVNRRLST